MSPCGGCGSKKKKVSKLPPDYLVHSEYKNSVMKDFMASRKQLISKKK